MQAPREHWRDPSVDKGSDDVGVSRPLGAGLNVARDVVTYAQQPDEGANGLELGGARRPLPPIAVLEVVEEGRHDARVDAAGLEGG